MSMLQIIQKNMLFLHFFGRLKKHVPISVRLAMKWYFEKSINIDLNTVKTRFAPSITSMERIACRCSPGGKSGMLFTLPGMFKISAATFFMHCILIGT